MRYSNHNNDLELGRCTPLSYYTIGRICLFQHVLEYESSYAGHTSYDPITNEYINNNNNNNNDMLCILLKYSIADDEILMSRKIK